MVQGIPEHLVVGEPELKWCEAICAWVQYTLPRWIRVTESKSRQDKATREDYKAALMARTNMSEARVDRALNLLYKMKRI